MKGNIFTGIFWPVYILINAIRGTSNTAADARSGLMMGAIAGFLITFIVAGLIPVLLALEGVILIAVYFIGLIIMSDAKNDISKGDEFLELSTGAYGGIIALVLTVFLALLFYKP